MIKELEEDREESQDPEVEFAIAGAVQEYGGLEILLGMIQVSSLPHYPAERFPNTEEIFAPISTWNHFLFVIILLSLSWLKVSCRLTSIAESNL